MLTKSGNVFFFYHKNTVANFADVIGATGVTNPSDLPRERVMRRISCHEFKSYLDIYPRLEPGSLLQGTAVDRHQKLWDGAGVLLQQLER